MNRLTLDNLDDWIIKSSGEFGWIAVSITPAEAQWIVEKGKERNRFGKRKGWVSKTTDGDDKWNISGVAGEKAVSIFLSKALGREVNITRITGTKQQLNEGDLLGFVEVKSGQDDTPNRWDLIVNVDQLKEDRVYIHCITCLFPDYVIITGWAYGDEFSTIGTRKKHNAHEHDIYVIPRSKLRDMSELVEVLKDNY